MEELNMKIMKVLTIGVTVGGISLAMNSEKADAAEWTPRTAEQIKAEIKGNEYTIVWGDTLSAISQATNITVQKLADMNKIANVDLIYAGNKLSFDGNVASVQNSAGETVAQTVIQDTDKVNPSQPVGQPAQEATTNNVVTDNTQTGNVEVAPSTPEQAPVQPDNGSQGGQTTPSTPENNQPSTPENGERQHQNNQANLVEAIKVVQMEEQLLLRNQKRHKNQHQIMNQLVELVLGL